MRWKCACSRWSFPPQMKGIAPQPHNNLSSVRCKSLSASSTKILAHCNSVKEVVSSSTAIKPPHPSPILLNSSRLHMWSGRPTTLTHASLAKESLQRHPTSRFYLSKIRKFFLILLFPLARTRSASLGDSNSNSKSPLPSTTLLNFPFKSQCWCVHFLTKSSLGKGAI